jgi:hypothetical protein
MSIQVPARAAPPTEAPVASSGQAPPARVVIATRIPGSAGEDGIVRVSWVRTIVRLAVDPGMHPWSAS